MRCSKCGTEAVAGKRFCAECGSPLPIRCSKCGSENVPGAKFCADCGAALEAPAGAAAKRSERAPVRVAERTSLEIPDGERKTITALFADIKGSTELEQDLDPEEARAIVDPALKLMIDAVRRYDGYIVQSTGDGIFALFGAPVAHEDHPQRALYAALRMQDGVRRFADRLRADGRAPLQIRVGVNTGEVVVRSIPTGEGKSEYTPIGHTTNLASRMQTLANPGSTVIAESTRRLVEGYFTLRPLGASRVKGIAETVNVYEVAGLGPLRTRLQRAAGRGLTKFVGREREMEVLRHVAEQAKAGRGQIAAAVAEAGVGKSRLFYEFKVKNQSGWMVLEAFSVSHGKASAYLPVLDVLRSYFKITDDDDERSRREKVAGRIAILDRTLEDALPYLFALFGLVEGDDPLAAMDAQIRKRRTLDAIKRILLRESINQPLMVIFEDLHWIDDESQAVLNLLADSIGTSKMLMLVNYRPEYAHMWDSKTYYTQLRLDPLGKDSADEMLSALLGASAQPSHLASGAAGSPQRSAGQVAEGAATVAEPLAALKRLIIDKTEGNPFFMEEIVQAMLEEGALVRNGTVRLARPLSELKLPTTVQAILASRIDRLPGSQKELLQTLAVLGKEFPFALVREVAGRPDDDLNRLLSDLQLAEFIFEQPAAGDIEYTFKHALTQEVAYNSILIERRKAIHERIAAAIEEQFAGRLEDHLGDLARHYSRSGNLRKAIDYLRLASEEAVHRSSYAEAVGYVTTALELLAAMPAGEARARDELRLRLTMGEAQMAAKGFSSEELAHNYVRAREIARKFREPIPLIGVLHGLWAFHYTCGNAPAAREISEELLALAEQLNDPGTLKDAHRAMGDVLEYEGDLLGARHHLEQGIALAVAAGAPVPQRGGPDPNVLCLTGLSGVLYNLGYPEQALARAQEAIASVDPKSDPFSSAMAIIFGTQIRCARREPVAGEALARTVIALCEEHGYPFWLSVGKRMLGWALALQGRAQEGIELMEQELRYLTEIRQEMGCYQLLPYLAEAYGLIGKPERALTTLDQWWSVRDRLGIELHDALCYRLRGEMLFKAGADEEAGRNFLKSIEVAVRQSARMQQLRATTALARLMKKQGRRAEARAMLADIYGWFTEGFDTADLKDAKSLLDQLKD